MEAIEKHLTGKTLVKTGKSYRLKRPLQITFTKNVIDQLKKVYKPTQEAGGLLALEANGAGKLICKRFIEVRNNSATATSYAPSKTEFENRISQILEAGNLPLPVHTHPTSIGHEAYDNKTAKFYLRSSKPDRIISRKEDSDSLDMPESIFVLHEDLKGGFGLSIYEGIIFPNSQNALSDLQIVLTAGIVVLFLTDKLKTSYLSLILTAFAVEFIRRPKYLIENGGLIVSLSS